MEMHELWQSLEIGYEQTKCGKIKDELDLNQ
jgi:hypothetical protein